MPNSMIQAFDAKELLISKVRNVPSVLQSMYINSETQADEYSILGVARACNAIEGYILVNRNNYFISGADTFEEAVKLSLEYGMAASEVKMKVEASTPSISQEELAQLKELLNKSRSTLNLSDSYTDIDVRFDKELNELVLRGVNLWVQNAYGKSRTISSKGINDEEIMIC